MTDDREDAAQKRREVWAALAWPYLDTDPFIWLEPAAETLRESGLSVRELRRIDRTEVAPALWHEGFFGEWLVFDDEEDPLMQRIADRLRKPRWRRATHRMLTRPVTWSLAREWWQRLTPLLTKPPTPPPAEPDTR